ncbi:nucleotide sugar dehydrogenase [Nocardioides salarius]|uniref:Nucleotide sugar dehydrogenase n=1 Tax=Nocardioides salarius TaxID=374513 RepID=A0ABS2MGA7_9ACTN|nr:hypothetical protein [Nocardioides salarius]MBM7510223.1 nucleotide sugar dehydrogenase [Nocardioides salarius]
MVEFDRAIHDEYPAPALGSCDFVTVCVGTPRRDDGSADLTDVVAAIKQVPTTRVLLRSTVPPGTTEQLAASTGKSVCFSPEYVGESAFAQEDWGTWANDRLFQIIGGEPSDARWFAERLTEIHGAETRIFTCTASEAELAKYMENSYFALKVTFANQFFDLCEALDADWFAVREAWLLDPRVERDHTAVFTRSRGFGGRCLPKDLEAILHVARQAGVSFELLRAVHDINEGYRSSSPG